MLFRSLHLGDVEVPRALGHEAPPVRLQEHRELVIDPPKRHLVWERRRGEEDEEQEKRTSVALDSFLSQISQYCFELCSYRLIVALSWRADYCMAVY